MRWDYTEGQDQRVVGDGSWIWVYQPDLEQVYKVDYREAFGSGGLVPLLADRDGLADRYGMALLDSPDGTVRLRLTPNDQASEILELTVSDDTFDLVSVTIKDQAGSLTQVDFESVKRNAVLDDTLFRFAPPEGVDIIATPTDQN
jgi:outer membrane lipoprotein carrier protein